jgi:hypothetical protein
MKRIPTSLLSKVTNEPIAAYLVDGVTYDLLTQTELTWAIPRIEGAKRVHANGGSLPEHWNWSWANDNKFKKTNLLAYHCFGIECDNEMQGLMLVNTINTSRLQNQKGKPLVYVDYIEVAPWNLKDLIRNPRYGAVGVRLIEAAIRFSLEEGFGGRVGLHSLPQAESFYENSCGMIRVGIDRSYQDLCWFEITEVNAKIFLGDES